MEPSDYSPLFSGISPVAGLILSAWYLWRFRGRTERARLWIPRTIGEEYVRFFIMPSIALASLIYGLQLPLALLDSDLAWRVIGPLFLLVFIAPVAAMFYSTFGEYVPAPRWLIPRWSYDPEKGHPFHIKIYKVKRKSD